MDVRSIDDTTARALKFQESWARRGQVPGADPKLKEEEIAFSCHLDHQRPGANDNASGCVTILEVARTLQNLIGEEKLARPARTIRFIFPPEIEGTMALLNGKAVVVEQGVRIGADGDPLHASILMAPQFPKKIKAVVHMDMVGGGPETKAVFHVTRGPMSLPSFVHDVAWAFAEWVNEESYKFAATGKADYPMAAPEGGKEPLRAEYSAYTMGSDHDVYQDSSFGIPAIYLNDWPDRSIHTNFDTAANIDTTKLKRAAFIGAASGYFLAKIASVALSNLSMETQGGNTRQMAEYERRQVQLTDKEGQSLITRLIFHMGLKELSAKDFVGASKKDEFLRTQARFLTNTIPAKGDGLLQFQRKAEPKGPLAAFGYDYFAEHAKTA